MIPVIIKNLIIFVENIDNRLYFRKKTERNFMPGYFGRLFPMLYRAGLNNNSIRLMFRQFRDLFFIEHEWEGKIDYEVLESDNGVLNYADGE